MLILNFNNELITRDEGLHTDFGYLMFRHLVDKSSQDKIYNIQDCQGHSQSASSVSSSLQIKLFVVASSVIFLSNTVNSF